MNDLAALRAKHDENVANLNVAKTSLADVSHELARANMSLNWPRTLLSLVMCLNVMSALSLSLI